MTLINNTFTENKSKYFGGAIYIDHINKLLINDTKFIKNHAGVSGGAFYSVTNSFNEIINETSIETSSNKADSYGMDFSSIPYYVYLENYNDIIKHNYRSGEYIPLNFTLYDKYNHIVNDELKYFSDIAIKVEVSLNDEETEKLKSLSKVSGNIGSFIHGILI